MHFPPLDLLCQGGRTEEDNGLIFGRSKVVLREDQEEVGRYEKLEHFLRDSDQPSN